MESKKNSNTRHKNNPTIILATFTELISVEIAILLLPFLLLALADVLGDWLWYFVGLVTILFVIVLVLRIYKNKKRESLAYSLYEESIEGFAKLTYRQRFALTEYGYLLSPENAEVVGKMLGNSQDEDILPFCQTNGKKISVEN